VVSDQFHIFVLDKESALLVEVARAHGVAAFTRARNIDQNGTIFV
jgi:hypothetical protein